MAYVLVYFSTSFHMCNTGSNGTNFYTPHEYILNIQCFLIKAKKML